MTRTLFVGLLAAAVALTPAYAAKKKSGKPAQRKVVKKKTVNNWEAEAWGTSSTPKKKPPVKKTTTVKKTTGAQSTVKFSNTTTATKSPVALKPPKPEVKPTDPKDPETTKPDALAGKSAEDLEKTAQTLAKKDPAKALSAYEKLVQGNPNYSYAGDVYADMYRLSERSNADLLTRLKYAGLATQKMESGLTRKPATQQQIQQFKRVEEKLINQWIETEIRKIQAGG